MVNRKIVIMLTLMLITGCTLDMENWVETEEEAGYEENIKEENDFYSVDYQYKETSRSLTDNIMDYLVTVDEDSTLYFLDNIPKEWIPKEGGSVVANCCDRFPMGFMCKVVSVEHIAGMYRIDVASAEVADIFEDFNFDMDTDVLTYNDNEEETDTSSVQIPETSDDVAQTRSIDGRVRHRSRSYTRSADDGSDKNEYVKIDWRMFDMVTNGEKQSKATRSIEDDYDEDVDEVKTETTEITLAKMGSESILGKTVKEVTKNVINTFEVSLSSVSETRIQKKVELKKKREYTKTTTANGLKFSYCIGHDFTKKTSKNKTSSSDENVKEQFKLAKELMTFIKDNKKIKELYKEKMPTDGKLKDGAVVEIPLPSCPFGIILKISPVLDVSLGIVGSGDIQIWTSKATSETDVIDGEVIKDKTIEEECPKNQYDVNIGGEFNISGGAEVFAGIGKKLCPGRAAGVGIFAKFTLDFALKLKKTLFGDDLLAQSSDIMNLSFNIEIGPKILLAQFGDIEFSSLKISFPIGETRYYPSVKMLSDIRNIYDTDGEGAYRKTNVKYELTGLGVHLSGIWLIHTQPKLYVYKDKVGEKPDYILSPLKKVKKLKRGDVYEFEFKTYEPQCKYYVVPTFVRINEDYSYSETTICRENQMYLDTSGTPIIKYEVGKEKRSDEGRPYVYHTWTEKLSGAPDYLYEYSFAIPFYIYNAACMDEVWEDFGFWYEIAWGDKKVEGHRSLMKKIKRQGFYIPELTFRLRSGAMCTVRSRLYCVEKGRDASNMGNFVYLVGTSDDVTKYTKERYSFLKISDAIHLKESTALQFDCTTVYDWENQGDKISVE